jgi:hypothetical protein
MKPEDAAQEQIDADLAQAVWLDPEPRSDRWS